VESERRSRQEAVARTKQLERELAAERKRVRALSGVETLSPEDATRQQIANAFFENFPQFQLFRDPRNAERLERLLAQSDDLAQASDHVWDRLTDRTLTGIVQAVSEETGRDAAEFDDQDRADLAALFFQMARADPEKFRTRYEREDPKLIEEFVTRLRTKYFEPARRLEASRLVRGQPRVPSGGPARPVVSTPPQVDFGDRDAVENAAVQYLRERGHLQEA
jgi:hypothetical protein